MSRQERIEQTHVRGSGSRWYGVRFGLGMLCIGALGMYAVSERGGDAVVVGEEGGGFGPAQPRATIVGRMSSGSSSIGFESPTTGVMIQVDRSEYCKQVATAVLVRCNHKITEDEVVFIRDARLPGNAIQQFADAFGYAIETGLSCVGEEDEGGDDDSEGELV